MSLEQRNEISPIAFGGFAIDIDGTLLRSDHQLSQAVHQTLQTAYNDGVKVILVSARPPRSVLGLARRIGLSGPMVALNGALVVHTSGEVTQSSAMLDSCIVAFAGQMDRYPSLTAHYYSDFDWYVTSHTDNVEFETAVVGFAPLLASHAGMLSKIQKIMVVGPSEDLGELESWLSAQAWPIVANRSKSDYLEITAENVTKGTALRAAGSMGGWDPSDLIAFGDGDNDLHLFSVCGFGAAMGNASDRLKAAADAIIGTNDEDAVHHFIAAVIAKTEGFPRMADRPAALRASTCFSNSSSEGA
ncbi:HAD family hydrolase [Neorhizobium petrolearium]|uniref:HAD family hydrolase n=1 Tax=Neorhizobium petrolearium TaxID=515361 RepID=UPI003F167607